MLEEVRPDESFCLDKWSWDINAKSSEVILEDPCTALFHPKRSCSTAAIRGTRILNNDRHYWEIKVSPRLFGTSIMFGIGTADANLHSSSFQHLLGHDENSWGLSHYGYVYHNGTMRKYADPFEGNYNTVIGIFFDGNKGTLTFYKDGKCLGVAFTGLNKINQPLYPIISSTAAKTKMTLTLTKREFISLQGLCRDVITQQVSNLSDIDNLCLPLDMMQYIKDSLSCRGRSDRPVKFNLKGTVFHEIEEPDYHLSFIKKILQKLKRVHR